MGYAAYDLDDLIVEQSGMSVAEIFAKEGEAGFRVRERDALRKASSHPPFVIAAGGGAVVEAENRELMAERGWTILLEAEAPVLLARIQQQLKDSHAGAVRPLLDTADPLERIRALKQARQPVYSLSDWTIHTDGLSADEVAREVVRVIGILENSPKAT